MNNPVGWFELPVEDMERAMDFYSHAFGYEFEYMDLGTIQMAVFPHNGDTHGTAAHWSITRNLSARKMKGPLLYFGCENIAQTLEKAEAKGGERILNERQISEEHGYMAVLLDSEGNRIALHSNKPSE